MPNSFPFPFISIRMSQKIFLGLFYLFEGKQMICMYYVFMIYLH